MAIVVECAGCKKRVRCPDQYAGKKVKCPACGAVLAVPASSASPGTGAPPPPRAPAATGAPPAAAPPRPSAPTRAADAEELQFAEEGVAAPRPPAPVRPPRVWTVENERTVLPAFLIITVPGVVGALGGWFLSTPSAPMLPLGTGLVGLLLGLAVYVDYRSVWRRVAERARSAPEQEEIPTGHPGSATPPSESLALAMLVIPLVAAAVTGILIWRRESLGLTGIPAYFLLAVATILSTALLAYMDGRRLLLRSPDPSGALASRPAIAFGGGVKDPASSFLVMLALWLVGYPLHFVARRRLGARSFLAPSLLVAVVSLAVEITAAVCFTRMVPAEILAGERIAFGEAELFYDASEITEARARAVGRVLTEEGYFGTPGRRSVTLGKARDGFAVSFVVKDGSWDDPAVVPTFQYMGRKISASALDERPVVVRLCDANLTCKKEVQCPSLGKRLAFGTSELYYDTKTVTEAQARAVGQLLMEERVFGPQGRGTATMEKAPDGFAVSFVVGHGFWDNPAIVAALQLTGRRISGIALDERPVTVRLCDRLLTCKKEVSCPSLGKRLLFGESEIFYAAGATEAEARAVVQVLTEGGFITAPGRKSVALSRTAAGFAVYFPIQKGLATDARIIEAFRETGGILSSRALGGKPVDIHLCDQTLTTLRVLEKIGPAPAPSGPPK